MGLPACIENEGQKKVVVLVLVLVVRIKLVYTLICSHKLF